MIVPPTGTAPLSICIEVGMLIEVAMVIVGMLIVEVPSDCVFFDADVLIPVMVMLVDPGNVFPVSDVVVVVIDPMSPEEDDVVGILIPVIDPESPEDEDICIPVIVMFTDPSLVVDIGILIDPELLSEVIVMPVVVSDSLEDDICVPVIDPESLEEEDICISVIDPEPVALVVTLSGDTTSYSKTTKTSELFPGVL